MSENEKLDECVSEPDQVGLVDYLDEFIQALRKQLHSDFLRWGNTWRTRPKEGQELRTRTRFDDYFDMFRETGEPVPWMKVIGNALICWIRDNHPELHIDPDGSVCSDVIGIKISAESVEEISIKEACVPRPGGDAAEEMTAQGKRLEAVIKPRGWSCIRGERLTRLCGRLAYTNDKGEVLLSSVVFTKGNEDKSLVVGRCDEDGAIQSQISPRLIGRVSSNGQYRIVGVEGLLATDEIYISYDYRFALPKDWDQIHFGEDKK